MPLWLQSGLIDGSSPLVHQFAFVSDPSQACFALPVDPAFFADIIVLAQTAGMACCCDDGTPEKTLT